MAADGPSACAAQVQRLRPILQDETQQPEGARCLHLCKRDNGLQPHLIVWVVEQNLAKPSIGILARYSTKEQPRFHPNIGVFHGVLSQFPNRVHQCPAPREPCQLAPRKATRTLAGPKHLRDESPIASPLTLQLLHVQRRSLGGYDLVSLEPLSFVKNRTQIRAEAIVPLTLGGANGRVVNLVPVQPCDVTILQSKARRPFDLDLRTFGDPLSPDLLKRNTSK